MNDNNNYEFFREAIKSKINNDLVMHVPGFRLKLNIDLSD